MQFELTVLNSLYFTCNYFVALLIGRCIMEDCWYTKDIYENQTDSNFSNKFRQSPWWDNHSSSRHWKFVSKPIIHHRHYCCTTDRVGNKKNSTSFKVLDYSRDSFLKTSLITIRKEITFVVAKSYRSAKRLQIVLENCNGLSKIKLFRKERHPNHTSKLTFFLHGPCRLGEISKF